MGYLITGSNLFYYTPGKLPQKELDSIVTEMKNHRDSNSDDENFCISLTGEYKIIKALDNNTCSPYDGLPLFDTILDLRKGPIIEYVRPLPYTRKFHIPPFSEWGKGTVM